MDWPNLTGDLSWAQVDWELSSSFLGLFISRLFRITYFVVVSHRLLSFFRSSVLTASVVIHWTVPEEGQLSFLQPVSWRLMQLFCSTSEANTILICSCHSIYGRFNHGCPVSYSILLSYSLMIPHTWRPTPVTFHCNPSTGEHMLRVAGQFQIFCDFFDNRAVAVYPLL